MCVYNLTLCVYNLTDANYAESHSVPLSVKNGLEISESDSMGLRYKLFAARKKSKVLCLT